jgi:hypothetical protein
LHPRSCAQQAHELTTGSTGSVRLSLHDGVTAYFVLSSVTGLFCHRRIAGLMALHDPVGCAASPQSLTPASGRQDHTTSPSATISANRSAGLVPPAKFWRRRIAAPFVRAPVDRSRGGPPCDSICAPDAVASTASHPAFVTTRDPPSLRGETGEVIEVICPTEKGIYFERRGWTGQITLETFGNSTCTKPGRELINPWRCRTSALLRIADSSRTSREVRKVPIGGMRSGFLQRKSRNQSMALDLECIS